MKSDKVDKKLIPPDGGWGWIIVVAYALNNIIMVPVIQGFSLVLKDVFQQLDIAATDISVIISVNSAFGMAVGLMHGPLLRNFGYRKIALVGSTIFTLGITMTAFATTFTHFMITYGLMASLGVGLTMSAFSLALNTYFEQKRGRAVGIAMTITGFGPILMPQLISHLMSTYGSRGAILVIGAMTLHSLVGTMLLQPVKWHATWKVKDSDNNEANNLEDTEIKDVKTTEDNFMIENEEGMRKRLSSTNIDKIETKRNGVEVKESTTTSDAPDTVSEFGDRILPYKWWSSGKSLETINLGSSTMIFDENVTFGPLVIEEDPDERISQRDVDDVSSRKEVDPQAEEKLLGMEFKDTPVIEEKGIIEESKVSCWKRALRRIVRLFDFDLLRDPIYVNMMLGMSIALFAEINFSILTPFILGDLQFTNENIATVMSTIAGVDLLSRGLIPFIGEWTRIPARHLALISLLILILSRTMLIFTRNLWWILVISIGLGFGKGIRAVNMFLVIPNYIPIERLASATGIQMVVNGIVLMTLGPLLGISRDISGSYVPSIILINSTTALTIVMWAIEMSIVSRKTKQRLKKQQYEQVDVRE